MTYEIQSTYHTENTIVHPYQKVMGQFWKTEKNAAGI